MRQASKTTKIPNTHPVLYSSTNPAAKCNTVATHTRKMTPTEVEKVEEYFEEHEDTPDDVVMSIDGEDFYRETEVEHCVMFPKGYANRASRRKIESIVRKNRETSDAG